MESAVKPAQRRYCGQQLLRRRSPGYLPSATATAIRNHLFYTYNLGRSINLLLGFWEASTDLAFCDDIWHGDMRRIICRGNFKSA